jgi:hypothetical protein
MVVGLDFYELGFIQSIFFWGVQFLLDSFFHELGKDLLFVIKEAPLLSYPMSCGHKQ